VPLVEADQRMLVKHVPNIKAQLRQGITHELRKFCACKRTKVPLHQQETRQYCLMRFQLNFIAGLSLLFMFGGVVVAFADADGFVGKRFFLSVVGILGWFIGNQLIQLNNRVTQVEETLMDSQTRE
jgi:xanthosine utilization system XapX-like protein